MGWLSEHLSAATVSGHRRRKSWAGPGKKICFSGVRRGDEVGKRRVLKLSVSLRSEVSSQALQMTVFPKQMGSPSKMSFCFHFSHKISERETQGREAWWGWGLVCSRPVTSDSWPCQGLQLARPPSPSPSPEVCPRSCPLSQWCYPAISSSDTFFPSALNLSQHRGLFQWVSCSHRMAQVLELTRKYLVKARGW